MLLINYSLIGQRIKEFRKMQKLTQAQLAEHTNLSASYISHIETGAKCASLEVLIQIANTLNVTVDRILSGNQAPQYEDYNNEITELLSDCSNYEKRIIFELITTIKTSLRRNNCLLFQKN